MIAKPQPPNRRLEEIKLLIFDFDGILTDNHVYVAESGERTKRFWVPDGVGVFMAHKAGLEMAVITGNDDAATRHRCEFLRLDALYQGVRDKRSVYEEVKKRFGVTDHDCMYIGDDLPDRPVFGVAGIAMAPSDAHPMILEAANWIGHSAGGKGIVREAIDAILAAKGVEEYTNPPSAEVAPEQAK